MNEMRLFLTLFFALFYSVSLISQASLPVTWSFEAQKTGKEQYEIIFTANAKEGWYVYSQFLEEGGPIPTSFDFSDNAAIKLLGDAKEIGLKKEGFDKLFEMQVIKYSGRTKFVQPIKVAPNLSQVSGFLTYMTCNDHSCLPPRDVEFKIELK